MRKLAALALAVVLLAVAAFPGAASADRGSRRGFHRGHGLHRSHGFVGHHRFVRHRGFHSRVFIGFGPGFVYPYYYYPPPYYVYTPPPVVVQEPPVYVQQQPAPATAVEPEAYWYYCESAKAYYPNVKTCAEAWIKVPPRTQ